MNPTKLVSGFFLILFCLLGAVPEMNGQLLKRLGKAAEKAAERTVERRVEKETSEKTDQALDSIFEPGTKDDAKKRNPTPNNGPTAETQKDIGTTTSDSEVTDSSDTSSSTDPKSIAVYSKFDFVPGDKMLFYDDFSDEFVGDFPSKWNTNGAGEIVAFDDGSGNWFELKGGNDTYQIANIDDLPENYTIEFDLDTRGIDQKTSSSAHFVIVIDEATNFGYGNNTVFAYLPLCQYTGRDIRIWNNVNGVNIIDNYVNADIRDKVIARPHISIAVNKERYRLYINETKHIDIPKLISPDSPLNSLKFQLLGAYEGKDRVFINNVKIFEGGIDLRKALMREGKVSTNGILFNSGSADIQPRSMGIIRQIYQVLQQESAMNLKIIGHTDSDGDDGKNLELSKQRADAVKNALVDIYKVSSDKLTTEGKGEADPVGDNKTIEGKSQNRRVEFIKI